MKKAIVKKLAYLKPIQGLDMKSIIEQDRVEYHINVYKHRFVCHACPHYIPKYKVSSLQKTS
jgi:hypothetical protein